VAVVAEVDDEGALDGLHGDPGPAAVARGLEAADEVLQQQRDGAGVGVALEPQREVRLRAPRVVVDYHLLIHIHAGLGERVRLQAHRLGEHAQELARQVHQLLAVPLHYRPPCRRLVRPPRVVAGLNRVREVGHDLTPVLHHLPLQNQI